MKKFLSILILVAVPAMLWAQGDSVLTKPNRFAIEKGTVLLTLQHDLAGGFYSRCAYYDDVDDTMYWLLNAGVGAEYAYRNNRTLGVNVHAYYVPQLSSDPESASDWNQYSIIAGAMHKWYHRRMVFGAGLSFELRHFGYTIDKSRVQEGARRGCSTLALSSHHD